MAQSLMQKALMHPGVKLVVWVLCLCPLAVLVEGAVHDRLGANPAEALIRSLGDWALRGLCLTLAVTVLRQLTGWSALARFRRVLGLFAFFYAALHGASYAWLDMAWDWAAMAQDLGKRPFILVGALALGVLTLLAATSPKAAVRVLGSACWQRLHLGIHLAAWLVLLHFWWMRAAKNHVQEVWVYVAIIAGLQAWRLGRRWRRST